MPRGAPKKPAVRSVEERNRIVEQWRFLPRRVYRKLRYIGAVRRLGAYDSEGCGMEALVRAADLWDEKLGIKFVTYAFKAIAHRLVRYAKRQTAIVDVPHRYLDDPNYAPPAIISLDKMCDQARAKGSRAEDFDLPFRDDRPESAYEIDGLELHRVLRGLGARDQLALRLHYWEGLTMADAAQIAYGLKPGAGRERFAKIRQRIRRELESEVAA